MIKDDLDKQWADTERLLGQIVMKWGQTMGMVYGLASDLEFEAPDAIRLCLAGANGDGSRITQMLNLLRHQPLLMSPNTARTAEAVAALKQVQSLIEKRDSLIHGVPIISLKRDVKTRKVIRQGCYLIQQRIWDEEKRFVKVPEAAQRHLDELEKASDALLRVARPMLFEDWEKLFGDLVPSRN